MAEQANATNGAIEDGTRISELRQIATSGGHLETARALADESDATVAATLEGLPPGTYNVKVWSKDATLRSERRVEVTSGRTELNLT